MPFKDPWLRDGQLDSPIEVHRRVFEKTGDPVHLWRAYEICRELMNATPRPLIETLPEWIFEYLDKVMEWCHKRFNDYPFEKKIDVAGELALLMGFKATGQGTRRTAFSENQINRRNESLASMVGRALEDIGVDPSDPRPSEIASAITTVAENLQIRADEYRAMCKEDPDQHPSVESIRRDEQARLDALALGESTIRRAWEAWGAFQHPSQSSASK